MEINAYRTYADTEIHHMKIYKGIHLKRISKIYVLETYMVIHMEIYVEFIAKTFV